jgi:hypothetical protein
MLTTVLDDGLQIHELVPNVKHGQGAPYEHAIHPMFPVD